MSKEIQRSRITAGLLCIFLAACGGGSNSISPQAATSTASADTTSAGSTNNNQTQQPQQTTAPPASTPQSGAAQGNTASFAGQQPQPDDKAAADATQARFNQPIGIARDSAGNLYIADSGNNTIRKIAATGFVTTLAGSPGASGSNDGAGAAARFSALKGIAVDSAGNVYVVDNSAVRRISSAGVVTTLAGASGVLGDADGPGATARFRRPWGIAVDGAGNVFVADTENALVRKITPAGVVSTHAGVRSMRGRADGSTATATFLGPMGIAADASGNLYCTDWFGPPAPNIPEGSTFIRRIGADGSVSTMAGSLNGESGPAAFMDTFAIAADAGGNVYVAAMSSVRKVSASGAITTVAGPSAQFQDLEGIAIDGAGNLYVTDLSNQIISKVTQAGQITLVAGKSGEAGSADTP
ncbi:hypothetical protein EGT07_04390 [Herbaspirillum sp. HC18]|nr:hypothetical protein EGT07_04390 [Herbaspirillum sp. HC18]